MLLCIGYLNWQDYETIACRLDSAYASKASLKIVFSEISVLPSCACNFSGLSDSEWWTESCITGSRSQAVGSNHSNLQTQQWVILGFTIGFTIWWWQSYGSSRKYKAAEVEDLKCSSGPVFSKDTFFSFNEIKAEYGGPWLYMCVYLSVYPSTNEENIWWWDSFLQFLLPSLVLILRFSISPFLVSKSLFRYVCWVHSMSCHDTRSKISEEMRIVKQQLNTIQGLGPAAEELATQAVWCEFSSWNPSVQKRTSLPHLSSHTGTRHTLNKVWGWKGSSVVKECALLLQRIWVWFPVPI